MSFLSDVTLVVCVESGRYESMAVLMVESLRRFGGSFANAAVIAITPRLGPTLSEATLTRFRELDVTYVRRRNLHRSWNRFIGKVWGLAEVEPMAHTSTVVLVDCDLLFLGEPRALALSPGTDVAACHPDNGIVGTSGADAFEPAWRHACGAVGLDIESLPWIDPHDGSGPIRFYLNSGVVAFRAGCGFPQAWLETVDRLLDAHVMFPGWEDYFLDQVALGLTIIRSGFDWQPLPYSHNYGVASLLPGAWADPALEDAVVLHYHDQLLPPFWPGSLERLAETHHEAAVWLEQRGPIQEAVSPSAALLRLGLRFPRAASRRLHRLRGRIGKRRLRAGQLEPRGSDSH